jgi:hypothetical protein
MLRKLRVTISNVRKLYQSKEQEIAAFQVDQIRLLLAYLRQLIKSETRQQVQDTNNPL